MTSNGRPTEDWDFFSCTIGDHSGSILYDRKLWPQTPLEGLTTMLGLQVRLKDPHPEHGMTQNAEAEVLYELDDALFAALDEQARYVGRQTTNGTRTCFIYCREPDPLEAKLRELMAGFHDYQHDLFRKDDANWSLYVEHLLPTVDRSQSNSNSLVLEQLAEFGDIHTRSRAVDHLILLEDRLTRHRIVDRLVEDGYTIEPPTTAVRIEFQGTHDVEASSINKRTTALALLAERHGGKYDGWGCHVARDIEAPEPGAEQS